ncbi:MAG: RloB family protein, partial [Malacoplasma sp.]|nr:RloB family protein [Malacoplasma sp.]
MKNKKGNKSNKKEFISKKILIFCEGQTEKIFISFLTKIFDSKIQIRYEDLKGEIKSKKILSKIDNLKKQYKNIDKIFLVYDFEHENNEIKNVVGELYKIVSKPSIEIIILLFLNDFEKTKLVNLEKEKLEDIIK